MAAPRSPTPAGDALRTLALDHPDAEEGVACEGTALEKRTVKVRGKAFLFLGGAAGSLSVMVKLRESLPEAARLAGGHPETYKAGAGGWVTANFPAGVTPPAGLLERWVDESRRLMTESMPARARPTAPSRKAAAKSKPK